MFSRRRANLPASRRARSGPTQRVNDASTRFLLCLGRVERAKADLAGAAPGGRVQGLPLADALAAFEMGLVETDQAMPAWRTPEVEEAWQSCAEAIREASRRAESLRLGEAPSGYEQLYGVLGDLMEPLGAFAVALDRFRELGA